MWVHWRLLLLQVLIPILRVRFMLNRWRMVLDVARARSREWRLMDLALFLLSLQLLRWLERKGRRAGYTVFIVKFVIGMLVGSSCSHVVDSGSFVLNSTAIFIRTNRIHLENGGSTLANLRILLVVRCLHGRRVVHTVL